MKLKIGLSAIASLLLVAGFVGLFYFTPEMSKDPFGKILSTGIGLGVVTFIVSTWCLSVAHLLDKVGNMVAEANISNMGAPGGRS